MLGASAPRAIQSGAAEPYPLKCLVNAQYVCDELLKPDVLVGYRPKAGVRFSPHFYNTDEELTKAIETVDEILGIQKVLVR